MSTAVLDLHNAVNTRFKIQVVDAESLNATTDVAWENQDFTPKTGSLWMRVTTQETGTSFVEFGGTRTVRHSGFLSVEIRAPFDAGAASALTMADKVRTAFLGVTESGVRYQTPTTLNIGRQGADFVVQVECPFTLDETI